MLYSSTSKIAEAFRTPTAVGQSSLYLPLRPRLIHFEPPRTYGLLRATYYYPCSCAKLFARRRAVSSTRKTKSINPFRTPVPFWGQFTYNLSILSPTYGSAVLKGLDKSIATPTAVMAPLSFFCSTGITGGSTVSGVGPSRRW